LIVVNAVHRVSPRNIIKPALIQAAMAILVKSLTRSASFDNSTILRSRPDCMRIRRKVHLTGTINRSLSLHRYVNNRRGLLLVIPCFWSTRWRFGNSSPLFCLCELVSSPCVTHPPFLCFLRSSCVFCASSFCIVVSSAPCRYP